MFQKSRSEAKPSRTSATPLQLGDYPTAVEPLHSLSVAGSDLWIKRDDQTGRTYGGNKVRKLEHLLAACLRAGAKRIVTVGAVGSHHVLATTVYGARVGLEVEAVLVPQPRTPHVVDVLRAGLAGGLHPFPAHSWAAVPWIVASRVARGAYFIPIGGSNVLGALGYVSGARELAAQVRAGLCPEPDVCVVALGSGGTAAGLAAGFEAEGLATKVVGVSVAPPAQLLLALTRRLARRVATHVGGETLRESMRVRLTGDVRFLGGGYGFSTLASDEAALEASEKAGIVLDPTYTAKAFASALWYVRARRARHVLFWHTLSSVPMSLLLSVAPPEKLLPKFLASLLL